MPNLQDIQNKLNTLTTQVNSLNTILNFHKHGGYDSTSKLDILGIGSSITGVLYGNGMSIAVATNAQLPVMSATVGGAVPTPPNVTTKFLRGDATWTVIPTATATVAGLVPTPPNDTTKFLRGDATFTVIPTMTSTVGGLVPTPPNNSTTFLRGDGTFAAPPGGSPGGSDTYIQYNSSGSFAGSSDFVFDKTHTWTFGTSSILIANGRFRLPVGTNLY